jgi:dipeptidase E
MKLLVVSTSKLHGQPYLAYLKEEVMDFFTGSNILFVPYARPGGMTWDAYSAMVQTTLEPWGKTVRGIHTFPNPSEAMAWADGIFTGGGNTFLLLQTLYATDAFTHIDQAVRGGLPYMGSSAGSNVCGMTIGTTNDMPVVYPPTFQAYGWLPFNINPHFLPADPSSTHMGETREQRIAEFLAFNDQPVLGLREGSWLHFHNNCLELRGKPSAVLFKKNNFLLTLEPGNLSKVLL